MPPRPPKIRSLPLTDARRIWLATQRLDTAEPFGDGPEAVARAVAHLGYVQIDTINVIERCHHHILFSRIPNYHREDLAAAQSADKTIFEYWTHALAYVPSADLRFFLPAMRRYRETARPWFGTVTPADLAKVMRLIREGGPLSIRDIDDDVLVEKTHAWASRKPSRRALQFAFFTGALTVGARTGMLKTYELTDRHFGWPPRPKPATERQIIDYRLDRALRSQGLVSLDSICHLAAADKPAVLERIESRVRAKKLVPVAIEGAGKTAHWAEPETLDAAPHPQAPRVHILSPFDPLIIQRKRLKLFFGYDHLFEAYVPRDKRVHGYFALPVLVGDRIVAVADLKTDRAAGKLLVQSWTWIGEPDAETRRAVDAEMARFERFQLGA